ncbi:MAG: type II toxin-antitoxin system death-on-curing family toxin [Verrucomicrobiales bacterium]
MKEPIWVLREVVLIAHEQSLAEFGGAAGIRDEGLLDSALSKPENLFAYGTPSVFELAASYGFGLVKNHPFIDGNKRIGFIVAVVFLQINGWRLEAS